MTIVLRLRSSLKSYLLFVLVIEGPTWSVDASSDDGSPRRNLNVRPSDVEKLERTRIQVIRTAWPEEA